MLLQDAISAALTVSCLIMAVSNQSITACSCLDVTDKIPSCEAVEFLMMTVLEKERVSGRGDSLGSVIHKVLINDVIQSHMNLTAGMEVALKTLRSYRHTPDLTVGQDYLILAEADIDRSGFTEICWMLESNPELCRPIRMLMILKVTA